MDGALDESDPNNILDDDFILKVCFDLTIVTQDTTLIPLERCNMSSNLIAVVCLLG